MGNSYGNILEVVKNIKTELMISLANTLTFSANEIPENVKKELDVLSMIEGLSVSMLATKGMELKDVPEQDGYVSVEFNGNRYITHKSKLLGNNEKISFVPNKNTSLAEEKNKTEKSFEETTPETLEDTTEESVEDVDIFAESSAEENAYIIDYEENEQITEDEIDEITADEVADKEDFTKNVENDETDTDTEKESETSLENEELPVAKEEEPIKAKVIGGSFNTEPAIAPMSRADVFVEETRKAAEDLVFDSYRVSIYHIGSMAEEMQFMIAPLKIQKYGCPTVPIIVSVYYRGKLYTASSFDKNEDGKNIVEIEINEYYFLCRGFFNDRGEFQSSIVTTGFSATQGDQMNITSLKKHRPTGATVRNGHLKFRYTGEDGPGIVEIFPLELHENDFVMMTRCGEFVEYIPLSNGSHGLSRALLFDAGIKSEVVCRWDDNFLEAEIVPV